MLDEKHQWLHGEKNLRLHPLSIQLIVGITWSSKCIYLSSSRPSDSKSLIRGVLDKSLKGTGYLVPSGAGKDVGKRRLPWDYEEPTTIRADENCRAAGSSCSMRSFDFLVARVALVIESIGHHCTGKYFKEQF